MAVSVSEESLMGVHSARYAEGLKVLQERRTMGQFQLVAALFVLPRYGCPWHLPPILSVLMNTGTAQAWSIEKYA